MPLLYPDTQTKTLPALSSTDIVIAIAGGPQLKVKLSEVEVIGNLKVTGNVSANGEVTATAAATPVRLSTHYHNTAMGPSAAPTKPS